MEKENGERKRKPEPPRRMTALQRRRKNLRDKARRAEKKAEQQKLLAPGTVQVAPENGAKKKDPQAAAKDLRVRAVFEKVIANPLLPVGEAMRQVGYSEQSAVHPAMITKSELWLDLLDKHLPNTLAMETHTNLLKASRVDHMTFISAQEGIQDADIHEMFSEIGCKVRKIIHRENGSRDVYFFMPDNKARASALDMLYKLRTAYGADKAAAAFSLAKLAALRDEPSDALEDGTQNGPRLPRAA